MATGMRTPDELRTLTPDPHEVRYRISTDQPEHASLTQLVRLGIVLAGHLDRIATALEAEAQIANAALERHPTVQTELRDRLVGAIYEAQAKRGETVTLAVEDAVALAVALTRTIS